MVEGEKKVLLLGSNYIAANTALQLMGMWKDEPRRNRDENLKLTVIDVDQPDLIFMHPKLARFEGHEALKRKQVSQWDFSYLLAEEFRDYDAIINCSMIDDSVYSSLNPVKTVLANQTFVTQLMDCLRKIDFAGRLIHVSSYHAYGRLEPRKFTHEPVEETEEPRPYGTRSASILATETMIRGMASLYGTRWIILRLGTLFGDYVPQMKALYNWTKSMMLRENLFVYEPNRVLKPFSDGMSSRDFVHEYDVTRAMRKLVEDPYCDDLNVDNEIYNIGGMGATANGEIFISNTAIAIKQIFKPWNPEAKLIFKGWRTPEEEGLRIWMSSKKADKKFGWSADKDMLYATKATSYFIAQYDLGWDIETLHDFKKNGTGDIDAGLEMAVAAKKGKFSETGVSKEMLGSFDRAAQQVGSTKSEKENEDE